MIEKPEILVNLQINEIVLKSKFYCIYSKLFNVTYKNALCIHLIM